MQNLCLHKLVKKVLVLDTLKEDELIISLEMSLDAPAIHETINSLEGFFAWSITVTSWLQLAIHCTQ